MARIIIDGQTNFVDKYKYQPASTCVFAIELEIPDLMSAAVVTSKLLRLRRLKWLMGEVLRAV